MKLNIGCGADIKEGWINLDMHNKNGADVVFDLNNISKGILLPFEDNHFDFVYCSHVIEDFLDVIPLIKEFIRITKVNGKIEIRVPNETNAWLSIYHKKAFSIASFDTLLSKDYKDEFPISIKSEFYGNNKTFSRVVANIINLIPQRIFYGTPIKYLFPSTNIRFILKKKEVKK